ncbi:MAG: isochorismate synthase [Deltaproteobacteria bacterium]|nr:isochorismate synthase [Deltaproteobacteria bacterium]
MISIEQTKQALSQQLESLCHDLEATRPPAQMKTIRRVEAAVDIGDPLDWLSHQAHVTRTYWANREGSLEMAGVGRADNLSGQNNLDYEAIFVIMHQTLQASFPNVRYYGGFRFNPLVTADKYWAAIPGYSFIVPRFEIIRSDNATRLAYNFIAPQDGPVEDVLRQFHDELDTLRLEPRHRARFSIELGGRWDLPSQKEWEKMVRTALRMIERNELQKIVLARKSIFELRKPLNPFRLLKRLTKFKSNVYYFGFQPVKSVAFIGATPERLYYRENQELISEAIAGTRARGKDAADDQALELQLLRSSKEIQEHRWVSKVVQEALDPICLELHTPVREHILKLPNVQHLFTSFRGKLKPGITDGEILSKLHPTPAVGGYPRIESLIRITELEPFDRGWYAGPVGWVSRDAAEFAVAIRSALVSSSSISLFAGGGIVPGSVPEEEWEEVENKILKFTSIFKSDGYF